MPEQRIDPVLVEKALDAFNAREGGEPTRSGLQQAQMEAALCVVFDELRLKEEEIPREVQRAYLTNAEFHAKVEQSRQETEREAGHPVSTEQVLLGWLRRPVEQGDEQ